MRPTYYYNNKLLNVLINYFHLKGQSRQTIDEAKEAVLNIIHEFQKDIMVPLNKDTENNVSSILESRQTLQSLLNSDDSSKILNQLDIIIKKLQVCVIYNSF